MDRPRKSEFLARINQRFEIRDHEGHQQPDWILHKVKSIPSPEVDEFRDLECFIMTFKYEADVVLSQGLYHLKGRDQFTTSVFACPSHRDEIIVTFN